jgi:hypothetical protein
MYKTFRLKCSGSSYLRNKALTYTLNAVADVLMCGVVDVGGDNHLINLCTSIY